MRITTGLYRGRVIRTVNDLTVRPATDRVRQTIYNILAHRVELGGITVLDLFAGSGSLGFEALSRGAARASFVESDRRVVSALEATAESFGCGAAAEIVHGDAMQFIRRSSGRYNLIFADPPYLFAHTPRIPDEVFSRGLVKPGGYLVIEHTTDLGFTETGRFAVGPVKMFGRTVVTFLSPKDDHHETDTRGLSGDV